MIDSMSPAGVTHGERFERVGLTADARTASQTRDEFARWLQGGFDLGPDRAGDLALATYEALANCAEFAYVSMGLTGTMDISASFDPDSSALSVVVSDRGLWRTAPPTPGDRSRGRGIALMTAVADDASIQTSMQGTTVRLTWTDVQRR
jgi:anti-sigma regulatory factor (Ser/Thr protein kinase)